MAPCAIKWCGNSSNKSNTKKDGLTFHRFPKDSNLRTQWINATKRKNWFPSTYTVLCSRHFEEDCFISTAKDNRRRLLSSAVPTLYLPILTNVVEADTAISSAQSKCITVCADKSVPSADPLKAQNRKIFTIECISHNKTPSKRHLYRRCLELRDKVVQKNKLIKNLRQRTDYLQKKIAVLELKVSKLENQETMKLDDC